MPYKLVKRGRRTCVVNQKKDGSAGPTVPGGCHPTRAKAVAHLRALYKNVPDAKKMSDEAIVTFAFLNDPENFAPAEEPEVDKNDAEPDEPATEMMPSMKQPIRFYFLEGDRAPDGRIIDPGATNFNRPPPLPITLQTTRASGHEGAVIAGAVTHVARFGNVIVGDGFVDLFQFAGQQLVELAMNGTMQTWSPDMGDAKILAQAVPTDPSVEEETDTHFISCTLLGFTVCSLPAMGTAVFELLNEDGSVMCPAPAARAPSLQQGGIVANGDIHLIGDGGPEEWIATDDGRIVPSSLLPDPAPAMMASTQEEPMKRQHIASTNPRAIAACAGPTNPPAEWFQQPEELSEPQRYITITDEGRVYFTLAPADGCHIGYQDMCVTPPQDDDFSYFHHAQVQTADGSFVATGPVALRGGHAPTSFSASRAQAHYDDPSTAVMDVCVGYDANGNIWGAGALRPGVTENDVARIRASGVSGDWRRIDGALHLIGICSVNTPGFPKVALAASGSVEDPDEVAVEAIIGMGTDPDFNEDCGDCFSVPTLEDRVVALEADNAYLREIIAAAGLEDDVFERIRASIEA